MSAATGRVVRLGSRFVCALEGCEAVGSWRIVGKDGAEQRACDDDLARVAREVQTDGFTPLTLIDLSPPRGGVA